MTILAAWREQLDDEGADPLSQEEVEHFLLEEGIKGTRTQCIQHVHVAW